MSAHRRSKDTHRSCDGAAVLRRCAAGALRVADGLDTLAERRERVRGERWTACLHANSAPYCPRFPFPATLWCVPHLSAEGGPDDLLLVEDLLHKKRHDEQDDEEEARTAKRDKRDGPPVGRRAARRDALRAGRSRQEEGCHGRGSEERVAREGGAAAPCVASSHRACEVVDRGNGMC